MTCDDLLAILGDREVTLFLDGSRIGYRGPREGVTTALLRAIARHKASLVERLGGTPASPPTPVERADETPTPRREPAPAENGMTTNGPAPADDRPRWLLVTSNSGESWEYVSRSEIPPEATEYWCDPEGLGWGRWATIPDHWRPTERDTRN